MTEENHMQKIEQELDDCIENAKTRLQEIKEKYPDVDVLEIHKKYDHVEVFLEGSATIDIPERQSGSKIYLKFPGKTEEIDVDDFSKIPKWISVKDRLPELDKEVLLLVNGKDRWVGERNFEFDWENECNSYNWYISKDFYEDKINVTHWMELPAAPEENV